jgi:hypothetical protein
MSRKKIAFFMHGGVGGGLYSQGFPPVAQLINELANFYEVTVFSLTPFNKDFHPENHKAFSVPNWVRPSILKWPWLLTIFLFKKLKYNYNVLYSFWGHPAGTVTVMLGKIFSTPSIVTLLGGETANLPEFNYGAMRKENTIYVRKRHCTYHCFQLPKRNFKEERTEERD